MRPSRSCRSALSCSTRPRARHAVLSGRSCSRCSEYTLLSYLMENTGRVLSRTRILNHVWGCSFDPESKVVDVYIRYLRQKIDEGEDVASDQDRARVRLQRSTTD